MPVGWYKPKHGGLTIFNLIEEFWLKIRAFLSLPVISSEGDCAFSNAQPREEIPLHE